MYKKFRQHRRAPGGQVGNWNASKTETNVDIIHDRFEERSSGTSSAAGLRKFQKAADEGNGDAAAQLAEVSAGGAQTLRSIGEITASPF